MTPLASYLRGELHRRDLSIEEFARRAEISTSLAYQIVRDGKDNVRASTLKGIARALDMKPSELLRAVNADDDDPVEQAIRQRSAEMRAAVAGIPRQFWSAIISKTFDRAIDSARDMADLLADEANEPQTCVTDDKPARRYKPVAKTNRGPDTPGPDLRICYQGSQPGQRLAVTV